MDFFTVDDTGGVADAIIGDLKVLHDGFLSIITTYKT